MKLVCLSDTHSLHRAMTFPVPDGDVLIHAGDCTGRGKWEDVIEFVLWYCKFPHKEKILIAGNHDWIFQKDPKLVLNLCQEYGIHYLCDSGIELDNLFFYGSPYTPMFCDWAFMLDDKQLKSKWDNIPKETNILITHGPAFGVLDKVVRGEYAGSKSLKKRLNDLTNIKLHVFGHIHEAYGSSKRDGIISVNASICTLKYQPNNPCTICEVT